MLLPIEFPIQLLNRILNWNYINSNATWHKEKCRPQREKIQLFKMFVVTCLTSNIDKTHAYENTCLGALPWSWNLPVLSKELKNLSFNCFMIYTPLSICKRALFTECHTGEWICSSLKFLYIRERYSLGTWNGTFHWMNFIQWYASGCTCFYLEVMENLFMVLDSPAQVKNILDTSYLPNMWIIKFPVFGKKFHLLPALRIQSLNFDI